MLLRDLQIIDQRADKGVATDFERFAIQVVELYLSHVYKRLKTHGPAKVVICLVPTARQLSPQVETNDVLFVNRLFDFARAELQEDATRKHTILKTLHETLLALAAENDWDSTPLESAYQLSVSAGLVFKGWVTDRAVKHPSLAVKARCAFEFDSEKVHLSVVVERLDNTEIGRRYAYWTPVRYDLVRRLLDRIEWVGRGNRSVKTFPGRGSWGEDCHVIDLTEVLSKVQERKRSHSD